MVTQNDVPLRACFDFEMTYEKELRLYAHSLIFEEVDSSKLDGTFRLVNEDKGSSKI